MIGYSFCGTMLRQVYIYHIFLQKKILELHVVCFNLAFDCRRERRGFEVLRFIVHLLKEF